MNQATEGVGSPGWPAWDDKDRLYWDKPPRIRAFRALQSWYREKELDVPPAPHPSEPDCWIGNQLQSEAAAANKNFLTEDIAAYARSRADDLKEKKATPVYPRLDHNMLGSMPLCFNLFAPLRSLPEAAAEVLGAVLDLELGKISAVEVEVAPRSKESYLNDNTAFDALITYKRGEVRGLVAVETKYTEPLSPVPRDNEKGKTAREKLRTNTPYQHFSATNYGWVRDAFEKLAWNDATNQLWRNALLALAVKEKGLTDASVPELPTTERFDEAHVLVVSAKADETAIKATSLVNESYEGPETLVKHVTFDDIIARCLDIHDLEKWATQFRRRYLDLTPVFESPNFADLQLDPELIGT